MWRGNKLIIVFEDISIVDQIFNIYFLQHAVYLIWTMVWI